MNGILLKRLGNDFTLNSKLMAPIDFMLHFIAMILQASAQVKMSLLVIGKSIWSSSHPISQQFTADKWLQLAGAATVGGVIC